MGKTKKTTKDHKDGEWRERKPSWKDEHATPEDIMAYLDGVVLLRYNVITHRVECHLLSEFPNHDPAAPPPQWQPITTRIENSLWKDLSRTKPVRTQDLHNVINSDYTPEYNPFDLYLRQLPRWTGEEDFLMELSLTVNVAGDSDEQILFYQCLKKWMVGMVAAWLNPEVVNNVILVFIGEQGSYKTTWFNYLLPPELRQYFYTKTNATRMDKDDRLKLTQCALICCEELDTMSSKELNQLKAAVTMPAIDERAAYDRYSEHRLHIASFCGTGNNTQFLSDTTGNRRWLPFEVASITSPREQPFNYAGIYAQAYRLYQDGFQYWFSQAEVERMARHNETFETPRSEEELVDLFFRRPGSHESGVFMPVSRAMQIVGGYSQLKLSTVRMGQAFKKLGFELKRTNLNNGYIVIQRSIAEVESYQKRLGGVEDVEGGGTFP